MTILICRTIIDFPQQADEEKSNPEAAPVQRWIRASIVSNPDISTHAVLFLIREKAPGDQCCIDPKRICNKFNC